MSERKRRSSGGWCSREPRSGPDACFVTASLPSVRRSALGGGVARAALGDQASRPIPPARGYGLPPWTTPDTTVLCASYSGETEETLACFESAGAVGGHRGGVTTGG